MTPSNTSNAAHFYEAEVVDEWDEDTISELVPIIDSQRELANKNKEIAKLRADLEEREKAAKAMAQALKNVGAPKRRFYLVDLLMLILVGIFAYAQLK